jgi:hypothetical protein
LSFAAADYAPLSTSLVHTQNESMAAGTAFAISYVSEIADVTPENLVVFTVLEQCVFGLLIGSLHGFGANDRHRVA